jgi:hypothetical protein
MCMIHYSSVIPALGTTLYLQYPDAKLSVIFLDALPEEEAKKYENMNIPAIRVKRGRETIRLNPEQVKFDPQILFDSFSDEI